MKDDKRSGITQITYPTYNVRDAISELSRTKLKSSEFISEHNDGALGYQVGYMLGETKASLDLLPQDVAHEQTLNDIKLDLWIRFQVNEFVTNKLMSIYPQDRYEIFEERYRKLSNIIYGSYYDPEFNLKVLETYFPSGIHKFVFGFTAGYSNKFHALAESAGVTTTVTNVLTQDVWRNWDYFLNPFQFQYRLDGKYLVTYSGDASDMPEYDPNCGSNFIVVNDGVYAALQTLH